MSESVTLGGIVDQLRQRGYTADLAPAADGLRVVSTGRTLGRDELAIREYYRFEGVSDPDDMSIVYAIEGADGTRGILVDAFGVYADPAVGAVLSGVPIRPAAAGERR